MTLLYVIGAGRLITVEKNFGKIGFAHFLGIVFSIVTAIAYVILHFVPRKAYRLLYGITFLLLLTFFLVAHSLGIAAPTVSDCNADFSFKNITDWANQHMGDATTIFDNSTGRNVTYGTMGQEIVNCSMDELLFAAAFINLILYVIAVFDVQNVLLSRVKSKTYGERFVEMGISN
ncbi:hypothetical protein AGDE_01194 [Angomonas deanei]|nr:hypothetical protein AGDE_01194 [Angomonas deanei]|eukprot:EPY42729.1 hypothetical protein AGDE_01194 [Angomonas deanei]